MRSAMPEASRARAFEGCSEATRCAIARAPGASPDWSLRNASPIAFDAKSGLRKPGWQLGLHARRAEVEPPAGEARHHHQHHPEGQAFGLVPKERRDHAGGHDVDHARDEAL